MKRKNVLFWGLMLLMMLSFSTVAAAAEKTGDKEATAKTEQIKPLFSDVKASDNHALYINYLADQKIMSGYPDGSFKAREGLTRAEAAVVLVKAAELNTPAVKESSFADVKASHWAAASIAAATKAGYLKGFPDGSYHPEEKLTRAQGIALLMRLSTQQAREELPVLKDMPKNHWAAGDMATALNAGMIGLSEDNSQVYPEAVMTRGGLARALGTLLTKDPGLYQKNLAGSLKEVKGEIKVTRSGTTTTLQNEAPVYKGDTITAAGTGSNASIMYPDGSSVLIKENTELFIKESSGRAYIKKDGSSGIAVDNVDIELKKGTIFGALATKQTNSSQEKQQAQAGETRLASLDGLGYLAEQTSKAPPWYQQAEAKKVKMKVDMPYGVAAIRGTYILVSVNQDGSCNVSCLTGDAEVVGRSGTTVPLGGGQSSGVAQGGSAAPPTPMSEKEKQEFSAVQQWVVNTALQIDQNQEATAPPIVEMIIEIPNQPVPPAQQAEAAKNTIDVVLNALQSSGIQLSEQVKAELEQKLKEIQQQLSQQAQQALQNTNPPANPSNNQSSGGGASGESAVSYINYATAGTYGPESPANTQTIAKNVIVSAAGVTLQNMIITRDLTLAAGIGNGSVTLKNVKVQGNTNILGGGPNSIIIEDCELYTVSVDNQTNTVRIVAKGSSVLGTLTLNSGARLEESALTGAGFSSVTTGSSIPAGATIILTGNFAAVNIAAPGLTIEVAGGSIGEINIAPTAGGTALTLAEGTSVSTLQINAQASIGGTGQIAAATINASGVQMAQTPSTLSVSSGVNATVGGQPVSGGSTQLISAIVISGDTSISIPASGSASSTYTAEVKNQNGNAMPGENVIWSLLSPVSGVNIDNNGVLTVDSATTAESCTVVATSASNPGKNAELQVSLCPCQVNIFGQVYNIYDKGDGTAFIEMEVIGNDENPIDGLKADKFTAMINGDGPVSFAQLPFWGFENYCEGIYRCRYTGSGEHVFEEIKVNGVVLELKADGEPVDSLSVDITGWNTISGRVIDGSNPLSGVTVAAALEDMAGDNGLPFMMVNSTTTMTDGTYSINVPRLMEFGRMRLKFTKPAYSSPDYMVLPDEPTSSYEMEAVVMLADSTPPTALLLRELEQDGVVKFFLTAVDGPLTDVSWKQIFELINSNSGEAGLWISTDTELGIGLISLDGNTMIISNIGGTATLNQDFSIPANLVVDRAGNGAGSAITISINGNWGELGGNQGLSDGTASALSLAVKDRVPWVGYRDNSGANNGKATVKKFLEGTWSTVGNPGFTDNPVIETGIALDNDCNIYTAFVDDADQTVMANMYEDSWETTSAAPATRARLMQFARPVPWGDIALPVMAYEDTVAGQVYGRVQGFFNGGWSSYCTREVNEESEEWFFYEGSNPLKSLSMAIDKRGGQAPPPVYIAYIDDAGDIEFKFGTGDFTSESGLASEIPQAAGLSLTASYRNNQFMLFLAVVNEQGAISVLEWDEESGWVGISPNPAVVAGGGTVKLAQEDGVIYLCYTDAEQKVGVMKYEYEYNVWQSLGKAITPAVIPGELQFSVENGIPYVLYKEAADSKAHLWTTIQSSNTNIISINPWVGIAGDSIKVFASNPVVGMLLSALLPADGSNQGYRVFCNEQELAEDVGLPEQGGILEVTAEDGGTKAYTVECHLVGGVGS